MVVVRESYDYTAVGTWQLVTGATVTVEATARQGAPNVGFEGTLYGALAASLHQLPKQPDATTAARILLETLRKLAQDVVQVRVLAGAAMVTYTLEFD